MAALPSPSAAPRLLDPWGSGYEAGCAGKIAYPTENAARAGLEMLMRDRQMRRKGGFDLYRCRYCGEWHHGHTGKEL